MIASLRKPRLSVRVPLSGVVTMVLLDIVASQQVMATLGRVQNARLRKMAALHVEGLTVALGPLVLRGDIREVYDTLDCAARQNAEQRMTIIAVADAAGRVLAATDPRRVPVDSTLDRISDGAVAPDQNRLERAREALSVEDFSDIRLLMRPEFKRMDQPVTWQAPRALPQHPSGKYC